MLMYRSIKNESKMKYKKCWGKKKLVLFLYLAALNCVSRFFILHLLLQFEFLIDGYLVFCETPFVIFFFFILVCACQGFL